MSKVKFSWTDIEHNLLDEIKHLFARNTLLIYPDFNKHFGIHTDDSDS